jgi:hypothetical protein
MRRRRLLIVILPLAVVAAVLGLCDKPRPLFEVVGDQSLDADRRLVSFRPRTGWAGVYCQIDRYQVRVRGRWTQPQEAFAGEVFVVPAGADACRLSVRELQVLLAQRAVQLFDTYGVAKRVPALSLWVARHLSDKLPPVRHFTVEVSLPRRAHNEVTGANAGGPHSLAPPTSRAARIAQFWRSAHTLLYEHA